VHAETHHSWCSSRARPSVKATLYRRKPTISLAGIILRLHSLNSSRFARQVRGAWSLCRELCRNPPTPARVAGSRVMLLGNRCRPGNSGQSSMDTGHPYSSGFFSVASLQQGREFATMRSPVRSRPVPPYFFRDPLLNSARLFLGLPSLAVTRDRTASLCRRSDLVLVLRLLVMNRQALRG
jgi:hypothetical protein